MIPGTRRLDRHLLGTFLTSLIVCAMTFLCLFVLVDCFQHFDAFTKAARKTGDGLGTVIVRYYLHQLPLVGYFLTPIVACAATAAAVIKLLRENELVVLKASGVSLYRAALPLLTASALLGVAMAADQELIIPRVASDIAENEKTSLARTDDAEIWDLFRVDRYRRAFQIQKYDRRLHRMERVTITQVDERGVKRRVIYADRATWESDPQGVPLLVLSEGIDYSYPEGDPFGAIPRSFGERGLTLLTNLGESSLLEREVNPLLLNSRDLEAHLEGMPPDRRTRVAGRLLTALHARLPECMAPLFLSLLTFPLVLWQDTRKYAWGMAVGLSGWVGYLGLSQVCAVLGGAWILPPAAAGWVPLAVLGTAGIWTFLRLRT